MFEAIGWTACYQTYLRGCRPDYALFLTGGDLDAALTAGRQSPEFWEAAAVVADAKRWELSLDRPEGSGASREFPPEQIEWYLDRSRKDFGLLTNGRPQRRYQPMTRAGGLG